MGNVINRTTVEYKMSVDINNYPIVDWIHNPVIPECEWKYWKIVDDTVKEMTQAEKDEVDATIAIIANLNTLKSNSNVGKDIFFRWIADNNINTNWTSTQQVNSLFETYRALLQSLQLGLLEAAYELAGEMVEAAPLTQTIIDDLVAKISDKIS